MNVDSIAFPNLNIYLPFVGRGIDIGNFHIAYYGLIIAIGMVCAVAFAEYNARRAGFPNDTFVDISLVGIVFGVIGARLYYVIFAWEFYKDNPISILDIRSGGLGLFGGVIGGVVAGALMARRKHIKFLPAADIAMPSILVGQIFGRWGNFFNREAFGGFSDNLFAMALPVDAVRSSSDLTEEMLSHPLEMDGVNFVTVHPTFLYESLWNLAVLIFIVILSHRKKLPTGTIFFMYLLFYGIGRFWIESLRTDQLTIGNTGLPISMVISALCMGAAAAWFSMHFFRRIRNKERG